MFSARPYFALKKPYYFQFCTKRRYIILLIALLGCIILTHQFYRDLLTNNETIKDISRNLSVNKLQYLSEGLRPKYYEQPDFDHDGDINLLSSDLVELLSRINDLKRIKLSIRNELRTLEQEKGKLIKEKGNLMTKNEKLISQINKSVTQLKQLELDIASNRRRKFEKICDINHVSPIIFNPMKVSDIEKFLITGSKKSHLDLNVTHRIKRQPTRFLKEFDLSLCPLTKEFKFHVLAPNPMTSQVTVLTDDRKFKIDPSLVREILINHPQYTSRVSDACIVVSILEPNSQINLDLHKNNLIINIAQDTSYTPLQDLMTYAAVASSSALNGTFRHEYDLVLPTTWQLPSSFDSIMGLIPPQSPIDRKYLASYFGIDHVIDNSPNNLSYDNALNPLERILQVIHRNSIDDLFLFIYNCGQTSNPQCYEEKEKMLELSTFLIIFAQSNEIDDEVNNQVYLALSRGTIPVIIGKENVKLPFSEVIDWRRSLLMLPTARLPEVHFILRSIGPSDIYLLKYNGRRIFENYLVTAKQILDTTIRIISLNRFNHPPPPVQEITTVSYYPSKNMNIDTNCTSTACLDAKLDILSNTIPNEILGPREQSFPSPSYRRNFSLTLSLSYDLWNDPMHSPMLLYPSLPIDPIPTSEYKFFTLDQGYRPIGEGLGGSGIEFSRSLGGEYPYEQFTIVLLTYERKNMLMKTLERLKGIPYLNKVLVIWNGVQHKPTQNLLWPDVGAPIVVVKVDQNSLNNRFLPYDAIETEAILSIDDDTPLRQDEIIFAFRVWRQSRDRIVGFPGRFHGWDSSQNSWLYNSNHSCELSMVLTGGAFFHKYYTYIYTYRMPEAIRSIVDKFMNCEDIAMNFLVAHLTRKPPIKVTSRWTFHCAGCQNSLSEEESHFRERHECLNTFASIYGYMPLLTTQHRSDSVLFKTRLPQNKQKCFRFV